MNTGETPAGCEKPASRGLYAVLAAIGILGGTWVLPIASMAATCAGPSSGYEFRGLQNLRAASSVLPGITADAVSNTVESADSSASAGSGTESMAPLLYLTPRVTSILQDVFGETTKSDPVAAADAASSDVEPAPPAATDKQQEIPVSPVAGTESGLNTTDLYGPLTVPENTAQLPKFQRQMYRTDI
ncbi:MAG: hypothetical protein ACREQ8_02930 [Woeseiaceae bacterium]